RGLALLRSARACRAGVAAASGGAPVGQSGASAPRARWIAQRRRSRRPLHPGAGSGGDRVGGTDAVEVEEHAVRRLDAARRRRGDNRRRAGGVSQRSGAGFWLSALGFRLSAFGFRLSALGSRLSAGDMPTATASNKEPAPVTFPIAPIEAPMDRRTEIRERALVD